MSDPIVVTSPAPAAAIVPGHYGPTGVAGVKLRELGGLSLASLDGRRCQHKELSAAVEREFETVLPLQAGCAGRDNVAFVWSGSDRWLVIGEAPTGFLDRLTTCAGPSGSVTDLTGSRTIVHVGGSRARDGLMKLIPIDLDEEAFAAGSAALTIAAHIPVHLWRIDDTPAYQIACPRSYGISLLQALIASHVEYGCDVAISHPSSLSQP